MMRKHISLISIMATFATPMHAADLHFCWYGANGYSMKGFMQVPDTKMTAPVVTQDDVSQFKIVGYLNGARIGAWSLADRTPDTTWILRYDTVTQSFPMNDGRGMQAWNANGRANDCGIPGFGFNAGSNAQDFCIDNVWITDSSINPNKPLVATPNLVNQNCNQTIPLSKGRFANQ